MFIKQLLGDDESQWPWKSLKRARGLGVSRVCTAKEGSRANKFRKGKRIRVGARKAMGL